VNNLHGKIEKTIGLWVVIAKATQAFHSADNKRHGF
jgi:hypothetical protein